MIELVESKFTHFDVDNYFKQGFYQFKLITHDFIIEAFR